MIRRQTRRLQAVFVLADVLASWGALALAWLIRFESVWPTPKGHQPFAGYAILLPVIALLWPVVFYFHRLYQIRRDRSMIDEALAVVVAVALGTILLVGLLSFWRTFSFNRPLLVVFLVLDILLVAGIRFGIHRYLEIVWASGVGVRRALIVGAGHTGKALADKLLDHPATGLKPIGFADDDPEKRASDYRGLSVVGTTQEVRELLRRHDIDTVFLALPVEAHRTMMKILKDVGNEMIDIRFVPDVFQFVTFKAGVEDFDGLPVINLTQVPLEGWNSLVKRSMDVVLSGLGLGVPRRPLPVHRARHLARGSRPRPLRAGADGARRPALPDAQVPLDEGGRRGHGRTVGPGERPAPDPRRGLSPPDVDRRVSAARQRLPRRHVARRPAPRAPRVRPRVQGEDSRSTCSATASAPGSRAGRRSTAGAGTPVSRSGSSTTSTTSRTGAVSLDVKILWLTLRWGFTHKNAY